jgi:hypothetical protein
VNLLMQYATSFEWAMQTYTLEYTINNVSQTEHIRYMIRYDGQGLYECRYFHSNVCPPLPHCLF